MKYFYKALLFSVAVISLSLVIFPAAAQFELKPNTGEKLGIAKGTTAAHLYTFIKTLIESFLILAGVIAVAFVIYGGVKFMMSAGDEKAAATAKNTVMYAIIGLIVVGLAAVIVNFTIRQVK